MPYLNQRSKMGLGVEEGIRAWIIGNHPVIWKVVGMYAQVGNSLLIFQGRQFILLNAEWSFDFLFFGANDHGCPFPDLFVIKS